ncbi:MAG TPA: hypothetical protein VHV57_12340 [Acidimicrobiales bacterium]|nr:hypothetical protein [Acidimicrobiales bacterium]
MSERAEDRPRPSGTPQQPTLNSQVLRRRADQEFFLRLRDAIQQNHQALERLGA